MNTSGFFLLLLVIYSTSSLFGQNIPISDTVIKPKPDRFVRVGFDISGVAIYFMNPEVRHLELSLDSEIAHNWFVNLEGGNVNVLSDQENYNYHATGIFFRAGVDFNLLKRQAKTRNDVVLVGFRYGFSSLNHGSTRFFVANEYWGDYSGSVENLNHQLHWVELKGGIKTEIFNNLFLGWSLRTRIRLAQSDDSQLQPFFIGGFGRGSRQAPISIQYSLMYKIGF